MLWAWTRSTRWTSCRPKMKLKTSKINGITSKTSSKSSMNPAATTQISKTSSSLCLPSKCWSQIRLLISRTGFQQTESSGAIHSANSTRWCTSKTKPLLRCLSRLHAPLTPLPKRSRSQSSHLSSLWTSQRTRSSLRRAMKSKNRALRWALKNLITTWVLTKLDRTSVPSVPTSTARIFDSYLIKHFEESLNYNSIKILYNYFNIEKIYGKSRSCREN